MDVNVAPFEIETKTRHGDMVRADVYLPRNSAGPFPVLLGASPYQKSLRHLPPVPATFPFIEYGPMQLYLDEGYAYVAMDTPGMGRSEGVWGPVSRTEGEAHAHLTLALRAARQHQGGNVGACQQQYQTNQRHQHGQRFSKQRALFKQPTAPIFHHQIGNHLACA